MRCVILVKLFELYQQAVENGDVVNADAMLRLSLPDVMEQHKKNASSWFVMVCTLTAIDYN